MDGEETRPYSSETTFRFSATNGQERSQVLHVEQQQPLVVGELEDDLKHAGLRVVYLQHPGEKGRPDLAYRRPDGVPCPAVQVPQEDRTGLVRIAFDTD